MNLNDDEKKVKERRRYFFLEEDSIKWFNKINLTRQNTK